MKIIICDRSSDYGKKTIIADNISTIETIKTLQLKLGGYPKSEKDDYPYELRIELVAQSGEGLNIKTDSLAFGEYSEKQINQLYSALMTFLTSGTFLDAESERLFKGEYSDSFYIRKAKKGNWL